MEWHKIRNKTLILVQFIHGNQAIIFGIVLLESSAWLSYWINLLLLNFTCDQLLIWFVLDLSWPNINEPLGITTDKMLPVNRQTKCSNLFLMLESLELSILCIYVSLYCVLCTRLHLKVIDIDVLIITRNIHQAFTSINNHLMDLTMSQNGLNAYLLGDVVNLELLI